MNKIQTEYGATIKPCKKCGSKERKTGEFRASGGLISSFFDFATERFTFVSCGKCGYTEFYNQKLGNGSRIIDFLGD
jgi:predicted nucleic-acid-binding Zn-ribbon protein